MDGKREVEVPEWVRQACIAGEHVISLVLCRNHYLIQGDYGEAARVSKMISGFTAKWVEYETQNWERQLLGQPPVDIPTTEAVADEDGEYL